LATSIDLFIGHGREQNAIYIYMVLSSSEMRAMSISGDVS
jgi:hypothetical protein